MTTRPVRAFLLAAALSISGACASTSFQSTWKAPDAQPVVLSGQKVIAFVLTKNAAARREPGAPAPEERAHERQRRERSPDSRAHEMAADGLNSPQSQTCRSLPPSVWPGGASTP